MAHYTPVDKLFHCNLATARTSRELVEHLTLICGLEAGVMVSALESPSSDDACVYEVLFNYFERIKSYALTDVNFCQVFKNNKN